MTEIKVVQDFSSGYFSIQFPEQTKGPFSLHLFDAMGREIKSIETGEHQIQFENPSPGIYFINAEGNGILFTGKSILIPAK